MVIGVWPCLLGISGAFMVIWVWPCVLGISGAFMVIWVLLASLGLVVLLWLLQCVVPSFAMPMPNPYNNKSAHLQDCRAMDIAGGQSAFDIYKLPVIKCYNVWRQALLC